MKPSLNRPLTLRPKTSPLSSNSPSCPKENALQILRIKIANSPAPSRRKTGLIAKRAPAHPNAQLIPIRRSPARTIIPNKREIVQFRPGSVAAADGWDVSSAVDKRDVGFAATGNSLSYRIESIGLLDLANKGEG